MPGDPYRDLSNEMRQKASIESGDAFLEPHCSKGLDQCSIFGALLSQPCSNHFVRVAECTRERFRTRGGTQVREETEQIRVVGRTILIGVNQLQPGFDLLVDDEVNDGFRHAQVRRRYTYAWKTADVRCSGRKNDGSTTFVETSDAVLTIDILDNIESAKVSKRSEVNFGFSLDRCAYPWSS